MTKHNALLAIIGMALAVFPATCQDITSPTSAASNMKVTVGLDRQVYLPGEVAQVTLAISNQAATPLVALAPFDSSTGCLYFRWKDGDALKGSRSPYCASDSIDTSNSITFSPGETKRAILNSYDPMFDVTEYVMDGGGVPERPGSFGLTYQYGNITATAEYTVATAQLEADVPARLHDTMFSDNPGVLPPRAIATYVHVIALRSDGTSYICVQQRAAAGPDLAVRQEQIAQKPDFDFRRNPNVGAVTPFKRVATSFEPVVKLTVTADSGENLTIEWTDAAGKQTRLHYPAAYPMRPPSQ